MQLQVDMLFDNRYILKKLLGRGGFSEVWLVEDTKIGNKKMALKVYAPGTGLDEDGVQLFSSEFELVFDLNHTNLLRPSHFDVCEHSPYLLMPFSEQGAATKFVGEMDEEEAWRFLHDVAAGLGYLHEQEPPIIHQDIKPDNILKDHQGHYQITDFGISTKVRSTLRKSVSSAKSGGTLAYMPPERFGKDNIPIKASDVWAMGATLFELLSGDLPFGEHGGLIQKTGAEIPNLPGRWSNELVEIITRCLQKETWDRPVAQQIVEWTDKHFKSEIIPFYSESKPNTKVVKSSKTIVWSIASSAVVISAIAFFAIKYFMTGNDSRPIVVDTPPVVEQESASSEREAPPEVAPVTPQVQTEDWTVAYNRFIEQGEALLKKSDYAKAKEEFDNALKLVYRNQDESGKEAFVKGRIAACDKAIADAGRLVIEQTAQYNRHISMGQMAFESQKYQEAMDEYLNAQALAGKLRDAGKRTEVNNLINACTAAMEEKEEQDTQERLALYNFVGSYPLGSAYMVVQRKADNLWGIIDRRGNVVEAPTYTQANPRLKNGNQALRNAQGWTIFDPSLNKIATGLDRLDDYL